MLRERQRGEDVAALIFSYGCRVLGVGCLLDSRLPDGSGVDLWRKLRAFDQRTPILFYSAAAYEIDKKSAMDCGAQGYLTKPSENGDLYELVKTLISGAAGVGSAGQVH